uniref:Uncharacterized protein n=1 Tax=Amorphochlora amoebiformis TaxID=1561963 RepID=A0A0H5BI32_9EUKA|nr:hypothetical protein [Amorphochlora amoebiformis]
MILKGIYFYSKRNRLYKTSANKNKKYLLRVRNDSKLELIKEKLKKLIVILFYKKSFSLSINSIVLHILITNEFIQVKKKIFKLLLLIQSFKLIDFGYLNNDCKWIPVSKLTGYNSSQTWTKERIIFLL